MYIYRNTGPMIPCLNFETMKLRKKNFLTLFLTQPTLNSVGKKLEPIHGIKIFNSIHSIILINFKVLRPSAEKY